jgi:hypothetical protein
VADDPRKCEGLLRDFCGGYRREIHALINALREKTAEELLSASADRVPQEVLAARLARRLEDFRGLDRELAYWAVVSWGLALGRFSPDEVDSRRKAEEDLREKEQERLRLQQQQEAKRRQDELRRIDEERRRLAEEDEENRASQEEEHKKVEPVPSKSSWKVLALAAAVVAVGLWFLLPPKSIEVQSVKFFAAGDGFKGQLTAALPQRNYKNEFRSNEAQFIWYDLRLAEPAPRDMVINVQWVEPDGKTINQDMGIQPGSYGITFGRGYLRGSPTWKAGRWVVDFSSAGKRIARGEFNVSPPPPPFFRPPNTSEYPPSPSWNVIGGLRFFEGPKQAPEPYSRIYRNRFDARSARYIRVEINLKNTGYQPPQNFKIRTVWYREGREFYRGDYDYTGPPAQETRSYSNYYGAAAPGSWQPGRYSVRVYIGSQLVRTGTFLVQ